MQIDKYLMVKLLTIAVCVVTVYSIVSDSIYGWESSEGSHIFLRVLEVAKYATIGVFLFSIGYLVIGDYITDKAILLIGIALFTISIINMGIKNTNVSFNKQDKFLMDGYKELLSQRKVQNDRANFNIKKRKYRENTNALNRAERTTNDFQKSLEKYETKTQEHGYDGTSKFLIMAESSLGIDKDRLLFWYNMFISLVFNILAVISGALVQCFTDKVENEDIEQENNTNTNKRLIEYNEVKNAVIQKKIEPTKSGIISFRVPGAKSIGGGRAVKIQQKLAKEGVVKMVGNRVQLHNDIT